MNISKTTYKKDNKNWIQCNTTTDEKEIYKSLAHDLIAKKLGVSFITRIKHRYNFDGTRTIDIYYDNGVKTRYIVER